ncbi:uncharacterized protein RHOBADRAFT_55308 [Rhodotorula graminis WP1]|uniref:Uncharacterized protein n=1 Tax=Rhodotorula graminis (strain WP1) TaxID=578459 RepID=A0A0P9H023_RHOGW|nr:uncharacterized protein RHOBADRAFT_55308 [Rhodotorula graminis WP1]KPV73078.1 hypothetical protein RHOBADRAFT_55308 [Rhodotorula graminis WP1]
MTIHRRRRASQNRYDVVERARELVALARDEDEFLRRLVVGVGVRREAGTAAGSSREGWGTEWSRWLGEARAKEAREQARNALVVPPELQHQAREAARERERRRLERATAAAPAAAAGRRGRRGGDEQ